MIHPYFSIVLSYLHWIGVPNSVYRITQDGFIDPPTCCDSTSSAIGSLLHQVAVVPASPFPYHFVSVRSFVESLPPIVISFTPKAAAHCLDNIT
jgi:hypothetical protein